MTKRIKLITLAITLLIMALIIGGCSSAGSMTSSSGMSKMETKDMIKVMKDQSDMVATAMASPDVRQSMAKIMSSDKMQPVMLEMMKNPDARKNMIKIMSSKDMQKAMIDLMADPAMKDTFESMLKDPSLAPLVKEAQTK